MLSREERKAINTEFWSNFRTYSNKFKKEDGRRVNWANYPTYVKQIFIRLNCDMKGASFSIEIQDKDEGIQQLLWEQFIELRKVLLLEMIEPGIWTDDATNVANQPIHKIHWDLENVSILNKEDHEEIFAFFMKYLTRFDRFYSTYNEILFGLVQ